MKDFIGDIVGTLCLFAMFYGVLWVLPATQYATQ